MKNECMVRLIGGGVIFETSDKTLRLYFNDRGGNTPVEISDENLFKAWYFFTTYTCGMVTLHSNVNEPHRYYLKEFDVRSWLKSLEQLAPLCLVDNNSIKVYYMNKHTFIVPKNEKCKVIDI
jgi:hypothetical protein